MRTFLALCALALVLSACGATPRDSAKDFSGAKRSVAVAVEDVENAARKDDPDAFCTTLLTDGLLAALKAQGTNCVTATKEAFKDADSLDLTVDEVTISGNTATAKVTSGTGSKKKTDTLELERDGTTWKVAALRA
jgi:Putative lumazine-binding